MAIIGVGNIGGSLAHRVGIDQARAAVAAAKAAA